MILRNLFLAAFAAFFTTNVIAQTEDCTFKSPFIHLHFGKGEVQDANAVSLPLYNRVFSSCPTDGHYSFASYTSECFRGDWHTIEDHTPGDASGNMLLVNSAYNEGLFFETRVSGFKAGKRYQFGVWLMNVCKPSYKCPFPLLPNLMVRLQTPSGKTVAQFSTGEIARVASPEWTQHRAEFTLPVTSEELILTMINNAPGGCGNDFALDDITFRECVKTDPAKLVEKKKVPPAMVQAKPPVTKKEEPVLKKVTMPPTLKRATPVVTIARNNPGGTIEQPTIVPQPVAFVPAPLVLQRRTNTLIKKWETGAGELQIDLYDNGDIDGDTVSIYHNNKLIVSEQRLTRKPISFRVQVSPQQPHHELVMVADNLGSIPPNTSLMIVTAGEKRMQVHISSTEQQNAKVVINLKKE
jgi:hypothetical protein